MIYKPPVKNYTAQVLILICFAITLTLVIGSFQIKEYSYIFQILTLPFLIIGIQLFFRFILSDYVYEITQSHLYIYPIQAKRRLCAEAFAFSDFQSPLMSKKEYLLAKKAEKTPLIYLNFCKNISSADETYCFVDYTGKRAVLIFEADNIFKEQINKKIEQIIDFQ